MEGIKGDTNLARGDDLPIYGWEKPGGEEGHKTEKRELEMAG